VRAHQTHSCPLHHINEGEKEKEEKKMLVGWKKKEKRMKKKEKGAKYQMKCLQWRGQW